MIILDVNTCLIDMDVLFSEQVVKNSDDSYTILLNARLSHERQQESYKHAMQHILNGDFEKEDVQHIEMDAHNMETAVELCI